MRFAVVGLNHPHIYGLVSALLAVAGMECVAVSAVEDDLAARFRQRYADVPRREQTQVLRDARIDLIVSAAINADRGPLAVQALSSGKHVLVDKPGLTSLADLDAVEAAASQSGKRWFVGYLERLESPLFAQLREMQRAGALGRLVNFTGFGPHRLSLSTRAVWTFAPEKYGGIITDVGSHEIELFSWLTGERIVNFHSRVGNFGLPEYPDFEDYGDIWFEGERGTTGYAQMHWFWPESAALPVDRRHLLQGTKGSAEVFGPTGNLAGDNGHPPVLTVLRDGPPQSFMSPATPSRWAEEMVEDLRQDEDVWMPQRETFHTMRTVLTMQASATRTKTAE